MNPDVGKLLFAGFEETVFDQNGQAAKLIRDYNVQAFMLHPHNYENINQLKQLIKDLQSFAYSLNFENPLILAIDFKMYDFMVSSNCIELTRFPKLLALVAADKPSLVFEISKAIALELRALGINMLFGPVLDIFSKALTDVVGINSLGVRPDEVIQYGGAMAYGFKSSGILTSGTHFPGVGKAFLNDILETSVMLDDMNQIENLNCLPFKAMIEHDMVDSLLASVVALPNALTDDINACLNPTLINDLLREKFKFDKVVITEDLEIQDIFTNFGIGQAASLAIVYARCDMVTVCNSFKYQMEVLDFLNKSFENGNHQGLLITALKRIDEMHSKLSWFDEKVEIDIEMKQQHERISEKTFRNSITVIRNLYDLIPLQKYFDQHELNQTHKVEDAKHLPTNNKLLLLYPKVTEDFKLLTTEFTELGMKNDCEIGSMIYTAEGINPYIDSGLDSSTVAVIFVFDLCVNIYQVDFIKEICEKLQRSGKYLVIVSMDSPYNLIKSESIASTYICTYDDSFRSLKFLPQLFFGTMKAKGTIPGTRDRLKGSREEVMSGLSLGGDEGQFEFLLNNPQTKEQMMPQALNMDSNEITNLLNLDPEMFNSQPTGNGYMDFGNSEPGTSSNGTQVFEPAFERKNSMVSSSSNSSYKKSDEKKRHSRKSREKPWVVEEMDSERDKAALLMVKTSTIEDLYFPVDNELLSRAWDYTQKFKNDVKIFIVRNPSMGVIYGLICVIVDEFDKCGRIEYMIVSRAKRRQSVGEILHQRAIQYITIERSCITIALGSPFPFLNYLVPQVLNEISTIWQYLETKDKSKITIADSSIQLVGFYQSLGWSYTRHKKGIYQQERKNIMHLNLSDWKLPGETAPLAIADITDGYSFIDGLESLNVKFVVSDDAIPAFNICYQKLKSGETTDDEEVLFSTMYKKADLIISEEIEEFNRSNKQRNSFIIYAVIDGIICGFCIVYTSESIFSYFYPLIERFKVHVEDKVTGITGVFVGLSSEDAAKIVLSDEKKKLIKLGLVTTAVQLIQKLDVKQTIIHNISIAALPVYENLGFTKFIEYCACFGRKGSFEWVV